MRGAKSAVFSISVLGITSLHELMLRELQLPISDDMMPDREGGYNCPRETTPG
jgi:hypothetical protein